MKYNQTHWRDDGKNLDKVDKNQPQCYNTFNLGVCAMQWIRMDYNLRTMKCLVSDYASAKHSWLIKHFFCRLKAKEGF